MSIGVNMQGLSEFKLKKFKIMQSEKGMKVSLDALIFAAYLEKDKKRQSTSVQALEFFL